MKRGNEPAHQTAYDSHTMSDQLTASAVRHEAASPVSLAIPCRAEHVALCRLVVGALGARDGLDGDTVADLKVIVTEACNCFLAMASDGKPDRPVSLDCGCSIQLGFDTRAGAFVISVLYPEKRGLLSWLEECDPVSVAGLGLTILKALTDGMTEDSSDPGGTILRLAKNLPTQ